MGRVREGQLREEPPQDLVGLGPPRVSLCNEEEEVLDGRDVELEDLASRLPGGEGLVVRGALHRAPVFREEPPDAHPLVELEELVVGRPELLEDPEAREGQVRGLRSPLRHLEGRGTRARREREGSRDSRVPRRRRAGAAGTRRVRSRGGVRSRATNGRGKK